MKKTSYLILLVTMSISAITANAQNREYNWYIAPSVDLDAFFDGEGVFRTGLTVGRYLGNTNDVRIDLRGDFYFLGNDARYISTSVLATDESQLNIFGSKRFFSTSSFGIGLLFPITYGNVKSGDFFDVMIPVKTGLGYRFTDTFFLISETSVDMNLSNFKHRSIFSAGFRLGVRF